MIAPRIRSLASVVPPGCFIGAVCAYFVGYPITGSVLLVCSICAFVILARDPEY